MKTNEQKTIENEIRLHTSLGLTQGMILYDNLIDHKDLFEIMMDIVCEADYPKESKLVFNNLIWETFGIYYDSIKIDARLD